MRDDHALGIGRGSGGEDDFGDIVAGDVFHWGCTRYRGPIDFGEPPRAGLGTDFGPHDFVADPDDAGLHLIADAQQKCGRSAEIHGDGDRPSQQTGPERRDPFRPIFAPEDHFVALADARFPESYS